MRSVGNQEVGGADRTEAAAVEELLSEAFGPGFSAVLTHEFASRLRLSLSAAFVDRPSEAVSVLAEVFVSARAVVLILHALREGAAASGRRHLASCLSALERQAAGWEPPPVQP